MIPTERKKPCAYWDDIKAGKIESAVHVSVVFNSLALVFFLFSILSPFTVWHIQPVTNARFGTGPFVTSSLNREWICDGSEWCGSNNVTSFPSQWNSWADIANSQQACSQTTNIYGDWSGPYGFCDQENGEFKVISNIVAIRTLDFLGFVLVLLATCFGCSVRYSRRIGVYLAAATTFIAMISTLASFSLMVTTEWYQDLRSSKGSFLPLFSVVGELYAMPVSSWNYGASFGLVIVVWAWTIFACLCYIYLARLIDDGLGERNTNSASAETRKDDSSAFNFDEAGLEQQDLVPS